MNKYAASIKYGVIAGIIMIMIMLLIYFINVALLAGMLPRIVYVVLVFIMIWGGITIRRERGNFLGLGNAFLTVFIISFTATMLFDSFHYVLYKLIDPEIPAIIKAKNIQTINEISEKLGLSDEKTEEAVAEVKNVSLVPTVQSQLQLYASSAVIGAIFSLVIGLFVNRPDDRPVVKAYE